MPKVVPGYKDAARSRIVEAALKVFSRKGYRDSTMDDVAKEVGVSKGAIYLYFKSKDDLLQEITKSTQESLRQYIRDSFQRQDIAEAIDEAYKLIFEKRKDYLRIMFETTGLATTDENLRESVKQSHEKYLDTIQQTLREQVAKGAINKDTDPKLMALMLSAVYMGVARLLVLGYDEREIRRVWKESLTLIFKGRGW